MTSRAPSGNLRPAPQRILVGWREWLVLPELGVPGIRAKVDSGARSSSLHVLEQELFHRDGQSWVRFVVEHGPRDSLRQTPEARVIDRRVVTDSSGNRKQRVFIRSLLQLPGGQSWPIEINLTERQTMLFPMLLGRTALRRHCLVDPARSYLLGLPSGMKPSQ